jgi:hypothetical protein
MLRPGREGAGESENVFSQVRRAGPEEDGV